MRCQFFKNMASKYVCPASAHPQVPSPVVRVNSGMMKMLPLDVVPAYLIHANFVPIEIIARNMTSNLFLSVPVRNELKKRLNLYYKKAKCSLMSLMYVGIPRYTLYF